MAAFLSFPASADRLHAEECGEPLSAFRLEPFSPTSAEPAELATAPSDSLDMSAKPAGELQLSSGSAFLVAEGLASFYANRFHGLKTANGEHFDKHELTAAHRSLPFGTMVRVTNLQNGRNVVVRINDRGPFKKSRIIDVSPAAAKEIGLVSRGVGSVRIEAYN